MRSYLPILVQKEPSLRADEESSIRSQGQEGLLSGVLDGRVCVQISAADPKPLPRSVWGCWRLHEGPYHPLCWPSPSVHCTCDPVQTRVCEKPALLASTSRGGTACSFSAWCPYVFG